MTEPALPNFDYDSPFAGRLQRPERILLPTPPIGNKIACLRSLGTFVLEEGPTLFRSFACTHAGSGGFVIYDGIPDDNGFFRQTELWINERTHVERRIAEFEGNTPAGKSLDLDDLPEDLQHEYKGLRRRVAELSYSFNGRELTYANPGVMGMWMFDGGCQYGLTVKCTAENKDVSPVLTITWMQQKKKA